jgi:hypothetical protein
MSSNKKAPDMPMLPPKEGELERRNAYRRLNPQGDEELVVKRIGKPDEETLNELADDILDLLESVEFGSMPTVASEQPNYDRVVNQPSPPQLVASRGDPARAAAETLTNMTVAPQTSELGLGPTPADDPETSRAKSPLSANPHAEDPISKYNAGYTGDGLNYGATHSESFVGTGAIAIAPVALGSRLPSRKKGRRSDENKDTTPRLENQMSTRRTINEWQPPFKGAGYDPGEHTMPKPQGKGVADRNPTQDSLGSYETELTGAGKEWPREGNDTEAMDRVDDENISDSASGAHESTHGEPTDGHTKKHGHNWPKQPKNSGQGVAEPFEGTRWSDGGTLSGGRGPGSDTWNHEEGPGMPDEGPITGTSGPQLGHPANESWSPQSMARHMGDDADLQALFDSYARQATAVCIEDFQNLLSAHGVDALIDETSLLNLMDINQEFVFHEGRDGDGPYWTPEAITEGQEGENRRPFKGNDNTLNEMQIRSPEQEVGLFDDPMNPTHELAGGPESLDLMQHHPHGGFLGGDPHEELTDPTAPSGLECPGCGYQGMEEECPECGTEMMDVGGEEGLTDPRGGEFPDDFTGVTPGRYNPTAPYRDDPFEQPDGPITGPPRMESREIVTGPHLVESLKNFMTSARSMIERNPRARSRDLAEALNFSWQFHASQVDARTCPTKVQQTLQGLMSKFPGFNPLTESEAMGKPEGTKLGGGDGPKENLPKQPTDMTTHGDKSMLGKHQSGKAMARTDNDGEAGNLWMAGTEKKMTGKSTNEGVVPGARPVARQAARPVVKPQMAQTPRPAQRPAPRPAPQAAAPVKPAAPAAPPQGGVATQAMQENISKLGAHVKKQVQESARGLGHGKFGLQFSLVVDESKLPAFLKDKKESKKGDKKPPFGKDKTKNEKPKKTRTPKRDSLAEALADAEEILQFHNPQDVTFEATFLGPNGQVALKQDIPLFTIMPRGPMVGEGKALFRFQRNAEAFADALVQEGVTCRVLPHNWGSAVEARTNYGMATRAFQFLAECGAGCAMPARRKDKNQKVKR